MEGSLCGDDTDRMTDELLATPAAGSRQGEDRGAIRVHRSVNAFSIVLGISE
jgi:hypothetical protein